LQISTETSTINQALIHFVYNPRDHGIPAAAPVKPPISSSARKKKVILFVPHESDALDRGGAVDRASRFVQDP
jgi:hypothetical protein